MLINSEEVYLYSPGDVKRWTEDEIEREVKKLVQKFNGNADTMYQLSLNIEVLANINYLYGEMISRLTTEVAMAKLEADSAEAKSAYRFRKDWSLEHPTEKAPAMSYFEAKAMEQTQELREHQFLKAEMRDRYKYAYEAMTEKINAIKKKMESIKYEEFGQ